MNPALEKLFNTPIKITNQSKRIISCYPNFVTTYLQIFLLKHKYHVVDFDI